MHDLVTGRKRNQMVCFTVSYKLSLNNSPQWQTQLAMFKQTGIQLLNDDSSATVETMSKL